MKAASPEARKTMPLAMSVGVPPAADRQPRQGLLARLIELLVPRLRARIVRTWSPISVSVVPGGSSSPMSSRLNPR
jgi:hypothetical protein